MILIHTHINEFDIAILHIYPLFCLVLLTIGICFCCFSIYKSVATTMIRVEYITIACYCVQVLKGEGVECEQNISVRNPYLSGQSHGVGLDNMRLIYVYFLYIFVGVVVKCGVITSCIEFRGNLICVTMGRKPPLFCHSICLVLFL